MSKNRMINTHFWEDVYVEDLDPLEKLLFLYLLTNSNTTICGIYEISIRKISFETGIDKEMVVKLIERFSEKGKIFYLCDRIFMPNFIKHQKLNPNTRKGVENNIKELPKSFWLDKGKSNRLGKAIKAFETHALNSNCNINCNSNFNSNSNEELIKFSEEENENNNSAYLLKAFFNLGYIPAESETVEKFRKWFKEKILDNHKFKNIQQVNDVIDNFETFWGESKKDVKNFKTTFLNNPILKSYKK